MDGQQRRYDAPCAVTIFHARRATPPVQPPRDFEPATGRVEVVIGVASVGFTFNRDTGEFTGRTSISFVNTGPTPLPAGVRLEATASRTVSFSATVSGGPAVACTQSSPTDASCPLPELRPQVRHTWDISARTRERGQLRLTFAIPVPASRDPTPNAPVQVPIPIP